MPTASSSWPPPHRRGHTTAPTSVVRVPLASMTCCCAARTAVRIAAKTAALLSLRPPVGANTRQQATTKKTQQQVCECVSRLSAARNAIAFGVLLLDTVSAAALPPGLLCGVHSEQHPACLDQHTPPVRSETALQTSVVPTLGVRQLLVQAGTKPQDCASGCCLGSLAPVYAVC